jgi:tetratricopeptide (TPR) repeat protein
MKDRESRLERCRKAAKEHPASATAQYNLGLAYTQLGRVVPAEEAYRKALAINPDLVEAWVNLGGALLLKWDFKGSLEANREAVRRQDDLLLAHFNMGQAHLYLGEAEGLVTACRKVVELDPNHPAGHYYLAVGLLASNQVAEARECLARAISLGHRPTAEFLRGLERAEQNSSLDTSKLVTNIGAEAPKDPKEN